MYNIHVVHVCGVIVLPHVKVATIKALGRILNYTLKELARFTW